MQRQVFFIPSIPSEDTALRNTDNHLTFLAYSCILLPQEDLVEAKPLYPFRQ
jgi:hypothetical protein